LEVSSGIKLSVPAILAGFPEIYGTEFAESLVASRLEGSLTRGVGPAGID